MVLVLKMKRSSIKSSFRPNFKYLFVFIRTNYKELFYEMLHQTFFNHYTQNSASSQQILNQTDKIKYNEFKNYKYPQAQSPNLDNNSTHMKLTKAQAQKNIQTQTINGETIYYSYAQKSQATLSVFKNDRILLFNFNTGLLYYINEPNQLPFKTQIPKPKKQSGDINVSMVSNPSGTNELLVKFVVVNQKNQKNNVEWLFTLQNNKLAKDWLQVIQNYKHKKIQQAKEAEQKKKKLQQQQQQKQNSKQRKQHPKQQPINQSWIHDTLGFGLMEVSKNSQKKPQPVINSPQKKPDNLNKSVANQGSTTNIQHSPTKPESIDGNKGTQPSATNIQVINPTGTTTKLTESKYQKQPQKGVLRESVINIRQTNLRESTIKKDPQQSNLNPTPSQNVLKPQSQLNIKNSKFTQNGQQSPQIKRSRKQVDPRASKITLRDELQSILERSHQRQSHLENSFMRHNQSHVSDTKNQYDPQNDWNLKFLKNQTEQVLMDFEQYAIQAFHSVIKQDESAKEGIRVYFKSDVMVVVVDARTNDAKRIKAEFRNYHFIMEACKDNFIVGVPLSCLIEYHGLVAMVQSLIPQMAPKVDLTHQVMLQIKDLQRYTRVKNSILKKAALHDLTELYQSTDKRLIYINQLIEYLPVKIEQHQRGGLLRPEHILDNVNQFMQGGMASEANRNDIKTLHDALKSIEQNVKILAKQLSTHEIVFANGIELKNIMHQRGINLKYLPQLYAEVTNKTIKKYIHTFMIAKVAKDYILEKMAEMRKNQQKMPHKQLVENSIKLLVEGSSHTSDELWKEIALKFKKQNNISMSHHDIAGPFFLNCLIKLIPASYDLTKLNDQKIFFKDEGLLAKGFIAELHPKIKSYHRFTTQMTDKIAYTCKQEKKKQDYLAIVQQLKLDSQEIPRQLALSKVDEQLKEYMSEFACPTEFDPASFGHLKLFEHVGQQPPTNISISTTRSYLKWCLQKDKLPRFKQVIEDSLRIIDYWFEPSHIYHCEFLQLLADYCEITGTIDESIKLLKQSLAICLKNGAGINKKTGQKYYGLAQKQLRAGRKSESFENFAKAKNIMESFKDESIKYPITLIKLSSLYLNSNEFENCIIYAKNAVEKLDEIENSKTSTVQKGTYDRYSIKAVEIMTRAFEIENKKNELYKVAQMSASKYNKTHNPQTYQQLVKICLTAVIFKSNVQKCTIFQTFLQKISSTQSQPSQPQGCLNELMVISEQYNVMEKFMFKFESLERILSDINSKRTLHNDSKDFINIVRNVVGVVGEDYVYGLIKQKEFQ